jgi:hypothetical protein
VDAAAISDDVDDMLSRLREDGVLTDAPPAP